jgi:hypothetical protein
MTYLKLFPANGAGCTSSAGDFLWEIHRGKKGDENGKGSNEKRSHRDRSDFSHPASVLLGDLFLKICH